MNKGLAWMLALALPLAMAQSPADSTAKGATSEIEQMKQMLMDPKMDRPEVVNGLSPTA